MSRKTTAYARQRGLHRAGQHIDPRTLKGNGITANNLRNTLLTSAEQDHLLREPRAALETARKGCISYNDLVSLSSAMHKGIAIEDERNIIRGLRPMYDRAHTAINAIEARCTQTGRWVPSALYGHELTALDDLLFAYAQALAVCTYGEFYKCQSVAERRTISNGMQVFVAGEVLEYPGNRTQAATS